MPLLSLLLPAMWLVTDERTDALLDAALARLPRGSGIIFRHYHLPPAERSARLEHIRVLARRFGHLLVLAGTERDARRAGVDGTYGAPARLMHRAFNQHHKFRSCRAKDNSYVTRLTPDSDDATLHLPSPPGRGRGRGSVAAGSASRPAGYTPLPTSPLKGGGAGDAVKRHRAPGRRAGLLRLATAHSPQEMSAALRAGADAILLSPVFATRSHPGAAVLGAVRWRLLAARSPVPVIALGGVDPHRARTCGLTRWAAIDGLS
ncbi:thiamine phosphate synthase [Novosphingobium colocasiae]|uniref:thiamine phosphate synthase n=1 Tax=Novosphingobium colocasiae TaxID=1256513 RepID=UPI0035B198DB